MNASDDRSVDSFKQNIESVTQIRGTVNDQGFKPNCLIIDEIDGAPQARIFLKSLSVKVFLNSYIFKKNSVQILIDFVLETNKSKNKDTVKKNPTLLRPIICICNDL